MKLRILAVMAVLTGFAAFAAAEEIKINTTEVNGRLVDDINLEFVNDPAVLGEWVSVDFVSEPRLFRPGKPGPTDLYLKGLRFLKEGAMALLPDRENVVSFFTWTRGFVMHHGDRTAARYTIKEIKGATYMFFEWKSGDYTIRHDKPQYYVLKKK